MLRMTTNQQVSEHTRNSLASQAHQAIAPVLTLRAATVICAMAQALLFICIYGGCLSHSAARADVPQLFSKWELSMPFVPAMILPYFSIYALFFIAFLLCRDLADLRVLAFRLSLAQLVAGTCYLIYPLQCGYQRPELSGFFGMMFKLLDATDMPYNMAPSLHVTTSVILGAAFASRTRGVVRGVFSLWFAMIAASTIFTWQHHLVDVTAGATLGLLCVATIRRVEPSPALC